MLFKTTGLGIFFHRKIRWLYYGKRLKEMNHY